MRRFQFNFQPCRRHGDRYLYYVYRRVRRAIGKQKNPFVLSIFLDPLRSPGQGLWTYRTDTDEDNSRESERIPHTKIEIATNNFKSRHGDGDGNNNDDSEAISGRHRFQPKKKTQFAIRRVGRDLMLPVVEPILITHCIITAAMSPSSGQRERIDT